VSLLLFAGLQSALVLAQVAPERSVGAPVVAPSADGLAARQATSQSTSHFTSQDAREPASQALPPGLARMAARLGVPATGVSVWVQGIGDPAPRVAFNADEPRNPASALKLVTTFAALEGLGPAHTWTTEVYLGRPLGPGGETGDLWLRGGGDPYLVQEEYWKLIAALRNRGLARIEGDLLLDVSRFDLPTEDRGAFDGQPDRVYNVLPHPLLVNFNAAVFRVEARSDGTVAIGLDPPLRNVRVDNRVRTATGPCAGYQLGVGIAVRDPTARDTAVLDGRFPEVCGQYELSRSVLQPESYAWGLFSLYWQQQGGAFEGRWRIAELPPGLEPFYVHRSRPLGDLIRLVNKFSNNVMTRHFEYALAVQRFGAPATPEKGQQAILDVLRERGVDTAGLIIGHSAGLARETRISARQLGAVLETAWNSPWMAEYVSSLSLAGLDGTMRSRLRGSPAAGRVHVKTGRLNGVSAVAGYVDAASGQRMMAVLMVNAPQAHQGPGEELQNAFLDWVYRAH
jgi:D-alanyl-D-alanine carboxypeptidase/D-alanyl-D-alanine-endopeptidase (penicillin-binding protein 4)